MTLQAKLAKSEADVTTRAIAEMGKRWSDQTMADPDLGPKIDQIKTDIGRAYDLMDPKSVDAFKKAMDETAIGNHPAFVRTFWEMAKRMAPGTHVPGSGPSVHGQSPSGQAQRPSVAASIWPNLKAS